MLSYHVGQRDMDVAPFTGAWIEMRPRPSTSAQPTVAPFTGAWIEIGCSLSCALSP